MSDDFIIFMYDKIGEIYVYLDKIMADVYDGKLSYENLPVALKDLEEKILFRQEECRDNEVFYNSFEKSIEYLEGIMNTLLEGKLNSEDVIPALGDLGLDILGNQEYFTGVSDSKEQEYLLKRIADKKNVLIKALEETKKQSVSK